MREESPPRRIKLSGRCANFLVPNGKGISGCRESGVEPAPREFRVPSTIRLRERRVEGRLLKPFSSRRPGSCPGISGRIASRCFSAVVEKNAFRKDLCGTGILRANDCAPSPEVVRLIKKRSYPVTLRRAGSPFGSPAPSVSDEPESKFDCSLGEGDSLARLAGLSLWKRRDARMILLDDLQIAGHLLTTSVAEAYKRETESQEAKACTTHCQP